MNKIIVVIFFVLTFGLSGIFAQKVDEKCAMDGWVINKKIGKDFSVRDNPSPSGKIIGNIPLVTEDEEETIVKIIGYSNGWLKIQKAHSIDDKVIFQGIGWISAKRVTAVVQRPDGNSKKTAPLYSQPKSSSKKVGTIRSDELIDIIGFDCFGLKVIYKGKKGWLSRNNICGNPVTTCS